MAKQPRHFLSLLDLNKDELQGIIRRASELKRMQHRGDIHTPLKGKNLGMVFEKSSTRTRVSFEVGMSQLGGHALFLSPRDTQLGRGEPIEDSAQVLSRMLDIIMIRTFEHEKLELFAAHSQVPVINALTDLLHPCQLLADMQTYFEHRGNIEGKTVTWIGDGNNMCHSYINAAQRFGFRLNIACPEGYDPNPDILGPAGENAGIVRDPLTAAVNTDLVVTDVWASMGQEEEQLARSKAFAGYQVNDELMAQANDDALFFHCLPAHRGEEVTASVMDSQDSVVWDEAENRLHSQKALMEFLLLGRV
ncbi:MAG: ornithine carbamoyltransferase [Candidatus Thiodiazotropha sp. (ex Myrtea spinifera)]|nr:ornithine carbamoyltransferase [Candidatus Thiodiazotropha sp. (ex Myrtea spinifera)]MCU7828026.1 ornithine carbamoyltransferase [Candidatus Thiodiazotropha sp. (ex Myrtea sp. 'scaly one' KF741663)]